MIQIQKGAVLPVGDVGAILTHEWDELARANTSATIFQTSGWYRAWLATVAGHERAEPLVLRFPATGPIRAGLALQISLEPAVTIRPLSSPWADYHDAVGDPFDFEAIESLACTLQEFIEETGYPLVLDEVVPGGMLERIAGHLDVRRSESSATAAIDLTNSLHTAHVLSRKEHLAKSARLARLGRVACRHQSERTEVLRRLPAFIEMHTSRWSQRADAIAPFDGGVIDAAFAAMVDHVAPLGQLLLTELTLNGKPIAMYFGFAYNERYNGYRTAFDLAHRRLSPGHLMLRQMIVDFAVAGFRELNLMRGGYAYKYEYANLKSCNYRFEI
jgi:CelD/BcsL family acetyltransferase involved in cellulose biosynthesis